MSFPRRREPNANAVETLTELGSRLRALLSGIIFLIVSSE